MTDKEIIQALECCSEEGWCGCNCPRMYCCDTTTECRTELIKYALDLIKSQQAEIDQLIYKLECLLCHSTGGKLSKYTYSLETMYSAVDDEVQDCCEEIRAETIKEFAEKLKAEFLDDKQIVNMAWVNSIKHIDNLVKEMVGGNDG